QTLHGVLPILSREHTSVKRCRASECFTRADVRQVLRRNNCCALLHEYATREAASDAASEILLHERACACNTGKGWYNKPCNKPRHMCSMVQHGATARNRPITTPRPAPWPELRAARPW